MGFLKRLRGGADAPETRREMAAGEMRATAAEDDDQLVEVEVVGEGYRQDALAKIAGPKEPNGKEMPVGATLRCEPKNQYDSNAVRVEVMGQLVGYVSADHAEVLSDAMQARCRGVLEGRGLIVGGWKHAASEGHYGVRVWLNVRDLERIGVDRDEIEPEDDDDDSYFSSLPLPVPHEDRLGPTAADIKAGRIGSQVTVVAEEHYQPPIVASMPPGPASGHGWPVLVDFDIVDCNPHLKNPAPCLRVRIGGEPVGYLTPAMTERYRSLVAPVLEAARRPTAPAYTYRGEKAGAAFWRLKVNLRQVD